jgi:phosphoribosyl-AMP cyclohydrolase / phosphoribosyl-ATP pyrophosphohydrolase
MNNINWNKNSSGLVPAIIQDTDTNQVLMLGYMNENAYKKTQRDNRVWFFSRTKNRLWLKGEKSKNYLDVIDIVTDCDSDTILIKTKPAGTTCHTGAYSCFGEEKKSAVIRELFDLIQKRKTKMPAGSYTTSLFEQNLEKICAKVEEESNEMISAAKNETKQRLIEESVDVLYHLFVLMVEKGVNMAEIEREMQKRRK